MAFAGTCPDLARRVRAFDIKTLGPASQSKRDDYTKTGVGGADSVREAIKDAGIIVSLVTADQASAAAAGAAIALARGAMFFDMNSVAPETKRAAARLIEAAGGRYLDVAIMAPVHPAGAAVPLLVSGIEAEAGAQAPSELGFADVRLVPGGVGSAASIKMIRSVIVKGIEALTAECVLAAASAGVLEEVLASLDAAPVRGTWEACADYNLDRMMAHGLRRAAEMEEVARTLDALGTGSVMTRGTVERQRVIGGCGFSQPPAGLAAKLAALDVRQKAGEAEAP